MLDENEKKVKNIYDEIDKICKYNSRKVLNAFHKNCISESHFQETSGYGYNDLGRDTIESVFKDIFNCEDALVRGQFISGTHALTTTLFGLLRPGDKLVYISGKPYDTLEEVIGIRDNKSSLKSFGISFDYVDLVNGDFDYDGLERKIKDAKVVAIQRSVGYANRKTLSIEQLDKVIKYIKQLNQKTIIMIDNCYCEFVSTKEPTEVGADVVVGSLIKNLGGGIAPNGAYVCGKKEYIELIAERLTVPGQGKEVGPSLGMNKKILQGLYMAPSAVSSSLKLSVLASYTLEQLGYEVAPKYDEKRCDIVQKIIFNDREKMIKFIQGIQKGCAIDAHSLAIPTDMPGYENQIIMASGSFTQGSSIELSCDGPIRPPYIAYLQGSLTYEYGYLGLEKAINEII